MDIIRYALAEKDGLLYVKQSANDWDLPNEISHFFPTATRLVTLERLVGSETAREMIGCRLEHFFAGYVFKDERGWRFELVDGPGTKPTWRERIPLETPKHGRKPIRYTSGEWQVFTAKRGWQAA